MMTGDGKGGGYKVLQGRWHMYEVHEDKETWGMEGAWGKRENLHPGLPYNTVPQYSVHPGQPRDLIS